MCHPILKKFGISSSSKNLTAKKKRLKINLNDGSIEQIQRIVTGRRYMLTFVFVVQVHSSEWWQSPGSKKTEKMSL